MEDLEQPIVTGRRRSRGIASSARAEALEKLKSIRAGGRRSGCEFKLENPIYDTVEESEYHKIVARRREEAQGFIVDDNGLGYGDEGQEEDWTKSSGLFSSDESEGEENNRAKGKKAAERKEKEVGPQKKGNAVLENAAALMGKRRISSMFTSTVFKNRKSGKKSVDCESIVDDVIAEFAPDEGDREKRRKGQAGAKSFVVVKCKKEVVCEGNFVIKPNLDGIGFDCGGDVDNLTEICNGEEKEEESGGTNEEKAVELGSGGSVVEEVSKVVEVKTKDVVKEEEVSVHTLNAKITVEKVDPALSATAGWQAVKSSGNGSVDGVKEESKSEDHSEFELDADGSLPFYIIDAHEEIFGANTGTVYLFGKVKAGSTYHSCCVIARNIQRCVYAIPNTSIFHTDEVIRLEKEVEASRMSPADFRKKLQEMAYELKNEVASQLLGLNCSSFSMAPVKRRYVFERSDIPVGENYVLKVNYPFKDPPLPAHLRGQTFSALLGTHCSALELFLVKRKIEGPSWLSIKNFATCSAAQRVSWCKFEVAVDAPKDIQISSFSKSEVEIDTPMLASEFKKHGMLSHFTVLRKLGGGIFPVGFNKDVKERNTKAGSNVIRVESSERALLNCLMITLDKMGSDVLVGHNIAGFDLHLLLQRAQACGLPSSTWSRIGRLKRSVMPKLSKGNTTFGPGASPGMMSCIAGRLLCDTCIWSRDLLKEVSYSLTQLAKTCLNKDRKEISQHDIPKMFQTSTSLIELIEHGKTDAWLSMELMFRLNVLPLTCQLANICGNLWGKTLQGGRAERVEYLLLHAFHLKKCIVPDKLSSHAKEANASKRRIKNDAVGGDVDYSNIDHDGTENDHGRSKRSPAYAGGLVLEPRKGLYDKYVLLLDFNSLYPSIIQEYNICFTTVERSSGGLVSRLPSSKVTGVLPERLKNLVERRRMVKTWMRNATGLELEQLDIQQKALKLTANSIYGCLGFPNSRFYAKHLAELITLRGREILQSTVDLVNNNLNLEVIYGDTDSIMIYSGLDDVSKAKAIAGKVIQKVNKKYRCIEIGLDGIYKRMLLLKKKKYAAVKVEVKDGTPYESIECKGLDMVRRDWSLLAKELGDFCLAQILSGGSLEDVVESIHNSLMKVQEDMRNGQVALEKYVITKSLTKPPESYPDAKNQPHVLVALRLKQGGYTSGCSAGDTVPYVICCEQGAGLGGPTGIAQRARHPDELKGNDGKWMIDIDYYMSQQIHPVVSRLCAFIQGTSPEHLAECLGLDSSKFQIKTSEAAGSDPSSSLIFAVNDEERYKGCEPLMLSCPSCSGCFECPAVSGSICASIGKKKTNAQIDESTSNFWRTMRCPKCPKEGESVRILPAMIANQVKRQAEGYISMYYKGIMMCDDETCGHTTRCVNLRLVGESERGTVCPNYPRCNGRLIRKYTEADLYKQLAYFCYLLDTVRCIEKLQLEPATRIPTEKEVSRVRPMVDLAAATVQKLRDRCAYGWVQMNDLAVSV